MIVFVCIYLFFFSSRRRHTRLVSDWSSDVCSSDLFHYKFGDNEQRMADDMKETAQEMCEAAGFEIVHVRSRVLTEGWSIHELGTARMGDDPKTSVLNQFQQSHDVQNLFVVDGSGFVSASCQNPTWTIMALCWRSCDYLADEFRKGNL